MSELLQQQSALQAEARGLLDTLNLIPNLSKIGETTVVGSVELGLMTWRDIDLEVFVKALNKDHISDVIAGVMSTALRRVDFTFIDNSNKHKPSMPLGYYLGIQYEVEKDKVWKIDTWFVAGDHSDGYTQTQALKDKISDPARVAILDIKSQVWDHPKYKKEIQSVDIYDAVLNHQAANLDDFKRYLAQKGKSLE